jgi:hypothetical protein
MMNRSTPALLIGAALFLFAQDAAVAHHSYAMFDHSRTVTVEGTVARLEWVNPHVFVWVYVKNEKSKAYDLYGFENGPVTMMMRAGWSSETLKPGEKVRVQFFPLADGRTGGYFIRAMHEDGRISNGDSHAPGVAAELAKAAPEKTATH